MIMLTPHENGNIGDLAVGDVFSIDGEHIRLPLWSRQRWEAWWGKESLPLQKYVVTGHYLAYTAFRKYQPLK